MESGSKRDYGKWSYNEDDKRDLRIDFIRGMVMFVLVIVHIDFFSFYNLLAWERFGIISGGEGFVILSGLVVGMIYGPRIAKSGWKDTINKLMDRAFLLYRVNIIVILIVAVLSLIPFLDFKAIMSFTDQYSKTVYWLYPPSDAPVQIMIAKLFLLKMGPHQLQILGLYVVLLMFAPVFFWFLMNGRTMLLLSISWILYFYNWAFPAMPTGAQFEYAFPILTWQVLFVHGLSVGYHREKISAFMEGSWRKYVLASAAFLFVLFLFLTQNNPNPEMPWYGKLSVIPADFFNKLYFNYFQKNTLGILRLVNYAAALIICYYLLTKYWVIIKKALGWYFIPVGQASLYVFVMHVFVIYILWNIPVFNWGLPSKWDPAFNLPTILINTLGHTIALMALWLMVKTEFLFKYVPR